MVVAQCSEAVLFFRPVSQQLVQVRGTEWVYISCCGFRVQIFTSALRILKTE